MDTFPLVAGTALPINIQLVDATGSPPPGYDATTPIRAEVWPGGSRPVLFPVAATWTDSTQGTINLLVAAPQTVGLDTGRYRGRLIITDPIEGPLIGYEWSIDLHAAPGSAPEPPSYCAFADLLDYGRSWVLKLQTDDDEAGFADERGRARSWLDDLILSRYPPQGVSNIGDPGYGAIVYGGSGNATPNTYLRSQLDADLLIPRGWVVECTAKKALSLICEGQVGPTDGADQYAKLGRRYGNEAMSLALSSAAEIAGPDGLVSYSINLGGGRVR